MVTKFMDRGPQIEKDMKELPKEKQLSDFSDKELASLAKLMKVDVKVLKEQRDMWNTDAMEATEAADAAADASYDGSAADAAADAAEAAADAAAAATDYASDDPAYDRSNWSAADLKRVEDLEAASGNAAATAARSRGRRREQGAREATRQESPSRIGASN